MSTQENTVVATPASPPSFCASVREALRGSHQDFTTGNLNRAILLLAIPMVLEMVLESLFAVTDVFWVGRLGANAVATVGITESMLALGFAIGLGVSMAANAMVARRICGMDPEDAGVGEHHQSPTRSLPDLRAGAVSADGRDGCRTGHIHGALDRCAVPVLSA